jgi:hypothetical protein
MGNRFRARLPPLCKKQKSFGGKKLHVTSSVASREAFYGAAYIHVTHTHTHIYIYIPSTSVRFSGCEPPAPAPRGYYFWAEKLRHMKSVLIDSLYASYVSSAAFDAQMNSFRQRCAVYIRRRGPAYFLFETWPMLSHTTQNTFYLRFAFTSVHILSNLFFQQTNSDYFLRSKNLLCGSAQNN